MKVPSSARQGYSAKTPPPAIERAIKKATGGLAKTPLGPQMARWAAQVGLKGIDFAAMDDDEIRGLSVALVKEMGASQSLAPRVVAKVAGLMEH